MNDRPESPQEAVVMRDYFEALLHGCCVVGESNAEVGRALLVSLRKALDGQAGAISRALAAGAPSLVDVGFKPMAVVPCRDGELAIYKGPNWRIPR